jgi:uncharacterized protein (DUF3820 family)
MSISYEDVPMPFGKYKGTLIADVPDGYLEWAVDQDSIKTNWPKIYELAKRELKYRKDFDIRIKG